MCAEVGIYGKISKRYFAIIAQYDDHSRKAIWAEYYGERKVKVGKVKPTSMQFTTYLSAMSVAMTIDELQQFAATLFAVSKENSNIYEVINEYESRGKLKRLVLETNKTDTGTGGLILSTYSAEKEPLPEIDLTCDDAEHEDPDPMETDVREVAERKWVQDFNKFYISKKDNWKQLAQKLQAAYVELKGEDDMPELEPMLSQPSRTPLATTKPSKGKQASKQIGKRKLNNNTADGERKKPKKNNTQLFPDEVGKYWDELAIIFSYCRKTGLPPRECVLHYNDDMKKCKDGEYLEVLKNISNDRLNALYKKCVERLSN